MVVVGLVVGAIVATAGTAAAAGHAKLTTVTLGVSAPAPGGNMLQLPIAQAEGYFTQEGIKIQPVFLGTSGAVMQAMAAGKVDIGMSTPDVAIEAMAAGQKVKMFYNWTTRTVAKFAVLPNSSIKTVADLRGKTIGVQALSAGPAQLARAALTAVGLNPDKDVQFVAVGRGAPALNALLHGQVDALMTYDTLYAAMTAGTGTTLRFIEPAGVADLFSSSMVASTSWIQHNKKIVEGFGRAWAKASVFAFLNPKASVADMLKYYPQTQVGKTQSAATQLALHQFRARMLTLFDGKLPKRIKWGEYPISGVSHWISYAQQNHLISSWISPLYVFTNKYVPEYNAFTLASIKKDAKAANS